MSAQARIEQINHLVIQLTEAEQEALLKALKKQLLLAKAERLSQSIKANTLDMEAIVQEVQTVRQQRYAQ